MNAALATADAVPAGYIRLPVQIDKTEAVMLDVRPRSGCGTCNGSGRVFKAGGMKACACVRGRANAWIRERQTKPVIADAPETELAATPQSAPAYVEAELAKARAEVAELVTTRDAALAPLAEAVAAACRELRDCHAAGARAVAARVEHAYAAVASAAAIDSEIASLEERLHSLRDVRRCVEHAAKADDATLARVVEAETRDALESAAVLAVREDEHDRAARWHEKRLRSPRKRLERLERRAAAGGGR